MDNEDMKVVFVEMRGWRGRERKLGEAYELKKWVKPLWKICTIGKNKQQH